jgi:BTB/POZ domain-containing protein 7
VLDESVIPKRYARVLLHAVYLDHVDLSLILRGGAGASTLGSLGEVQALTGRGVQRPTALDEAMELYQVGGRATTTLGLGLGSNNVRSCRSYVII